jgi:hypothetical protein
MKFPEGGAGDCAGTGAHDYHPEAKGYTIVMVEQNFRFARHWRTGFM